MNVPDNRILVVGQKLVKFYLTRRGNTVVQALIELRPDLIVQHNLQDTFPVHNLAHKVQEFITKYNKSEVLFEGIWRKEWRYRLHGIGCELNHLHSEEHFDWDISNPSLFYIGVFQSHIKWRCQNHITDENIRIFLQWLDVDDNNFEAFIEILKNHHVISSNDTYLWSLTN
jgi:hypothetical protein